MDKYKAGPRWLSNDEKEEKQKELKRREREDAPFNYNPVKDRLK